MPGFRTHYLFGALSDAKNTVPAVARYPQSFNLGQQGPDIFFYSPLAHLLYTEHLGGQLHAGRTGAMIAALIHARNRMTTRVDRAISDAYICGFIGHYTLDTTVHPYVHYRTKKIKNRHRPNYTFGIHVLLETDMDIAVLRNALHQKPSAFHCADTIALTKKEQAVISRLLSEAVSEAYPHIWLPPRLVSFALLCIRLGNVLLHDTSGRRKRLLRLVDERLIGNAFLSSLIATDTHKTYKDPCNLRHRPWRNPWKPSFVSRESVYDLMARARKDYHKRLTLYRSLVKTGASSDFFASIGNLSYDTGLSTST